MKSDVLELIHDITHQYRSQQFRALRDGDITHMDGKVLGYFYRHPGATQRDLVVYSGRDKAQLARLIKSLRQRDLLSAEVDSGDRRNMKLTLTPAGQEVYAHLQQAAQRVTRSALTGFTPAEQQQLHDLLARLQVNLVATEA